MNGDSCISLLSDGRAHPMSAEHHGGVLGHIGNVIDKDGAATAEVADHVLVVHDLVIHVDRTIAPDIQKLIDDIDGHVYTGTETSGIGQNQLHRWVLEGVRALMIAACWGASGIRGLVAASAGSRYSVHLPPEAK